MKKTVILFLIFLFAGNLQAQVPNLFKYQALIRDNKGAILANFTLQIRLSIVAETFDGSTIYSEVHTAKTNPFGLVNLNIGAGLPEYGSFDQINWGGSDYFVRIEVDENSENNFTFLGVSQLLSVPYALYAEKTAEKNLDNDPENELQSLNYENGNLSISNKNSVFIDITDDDADPENEAISNLVLNNDVLEITEGGIKKTINLSELAGLQALSYNASTGVLSLENGGSINLSELENDEDFLIDNELITSFILDGSSLKITEAGIISTVDLSYFLDNQILSFDQANSTLKIADGNTVDLTSLINDADYDATNELQTLEATGNQITISNGNTVTLNEVFTVSDSDKDTKINTEFFPDEDIIRFYAGGVEVISIGKDKVLEFASSNSLIGNSAGKLITTGSENAVFGYFSGKSLTSASQNTFIGAFSGESTEIAGENTFVGFSSGKTNTTGVSNAFFAANSGLENTSGRFNTFMGANSGLKNSTGNSNVFIGYQSGNNNTSFSENTFVGSKSGNANSGNQNAFFGFETGLNSLGNYNTFLGTQAGFSTQSADLNTFIGYKAGYSNTGGENNLFIGHESGFSSATASENTYIGNQAGYANQTGIFNTFLGFKAGKNNIASSNTFIGYKTGFNNQGAENIFIGKQTGELNSNGSENIYIGNYAAQNNGGSQNVTIGSSAGNSGIAASKNTILGYQAGFGIPGDGNVLLGYRAGYNETGSNKLYIENSNSDLPLIYGEFDTDILRFNGKVGVNTTPTQALSVNGAVNIGNTSENTTGALRFSGTNFEGYNGSEWLKLDLQKTHALQDFNAETEVSVEKTSNDNTIRFFTNSTERLNITENGTFQIVGKNFFIGESSGFKVTSANENIMIGYNAGLELTEGSNNIALGHLAGINFTTAQNNLVLGNLSGYSGVNGANNTFIGQSSGYSNISGSGNVFIGYQAGYDETASDKLYIQNSRTSDPLIYGDFLNQQIVMNADVSIDGNLPVEKLEVNGAVKIGNTFTETEGTIKWDGTNFQAYTGSEWKILDFQYFDLIRNDLNSTKLAINTSTSTHSFDYTASNNAILKIKESTIELMGNDVFIGEGSGSAVTTGDKNVFIGYNSGIVTAQGEENVFIGYKSGEKNTSGSMNTFVGHRTGNNNTLGIRNFFGGYQSGHENTTGSDNVMLGFGAGYSNISGNENTFVGNYSGLQNKGYGNVFLGMNAGENNLSGAGNIFIGKNAGMNETGSNKLYISNSDTGTPLIYGEFDNNVVEINAKLNVKETLHLRPQTSAPSNPTVGDIYLGTDDKLYIYVSTNGGEWKAVAFQ